jgi:hypothetical protein
MEEGRQLLGTQMTIVLFSKIRNRTPGWLQSSAGERTIDAAGHEHDRHNQVILTREGS